MSVDTTPLYPSAPTSRGDAEPGLDAPEFARRVERRRATLRLFLVLLAITAALRLPGFFVDVFNSDETFLATQAEVIRDGGKLYEEAADRKPPLVPYVYTATFALFGTTALWSVRVVAMLAVALTALLLALEARRRYGPRAAWIAGILMVLASVAFAPQDGQAANFEVFMLPAMTAAVLLARRGRAFESGAAVAIATLAKQTGVATLLPVLYVAHKLRGRRGASDTMLGFTLPLTVVALLIGPGELLYWTALANGSYLSVHGAWGFVAVMLLVMTFAFLACNLPIVWTLPRAWRERKTAGRDDVDLWLWLASAAVSVAFGLRFFGHYYFQLIPPLCLITTGVLVRSSRTTLVRTVAVAGIAAAVFSGAGYFVRPFDRKVEYKSVSKYLEAHTRRDDRVLVWGQAPEIYWSSKTRPATRFLTSSFLSGADPGRPPRYASPDDVSQRTWNLFFEDFATHPPRYILDTTPGDIRNAQYAPISEFPDLARIVFRQYDYVRAIDGIAIYERKPGSPPPPIPATTPSSQPADGEAPPPAITGAP
jgi:MFS family permease